MQSRATGCVYSAKWIQWPSLYCHCQLASVCVCVTSLKSGVHATFALCALARCKAEDDHKDIVPNRHGLTATWNSADNGSLHSGNTGGLVVCSGLVFWLLFSGRKKKGHESRPGGFFPLLGGAVAAGIFGEGIESYRLRICTL